MAKKKSLSAADREFLALVARAVLTNPFTPQRLELDSRIAGKPVDPGMPEEERINLFSPVVEQRLRGLESQGLGKGFGLDTFEVTLQVRQQEFQSLAKQCVIVDCEQFHQAVCLLKAG